LRVSILRTDERPHPIVLILLRDNRSQTETTGLFNIADDEPAAVSDGYHSWPMCRERRSLSVFRPGLGASRWSRME